MSAAVRVWGCADQYNLTFEQTTSGDWHAAVPADLKDGQYAVELWAENAIGEQTYWTGILYMMNSRMVCIRLTEESYQVILLPERLDVNIMESRYHVVIMQRRCASATCI